MIHIDALPPAPKLLCDDFDEADRDSSGGFASDIEAAGGGAGQQQVPRRSVASDAVTAASLLFVIWAAASDGGESPLKTRDADSHFVNDDAISIAMSRALLKKMQLLVRIPIARRSGRRLLL
jgi:hypothetical protein